jgi:predicted amidohydrolase YtcJ
LADLEADREELELAITDGAARRMLVSAHASGDSAADDPLRAEVDELDRLIGRLRHALDAEGR